MPAGQVDGSTIGVIPVDSIFSPVRKVNYNVEHTRVGQATNYDKLTLEVWTDGTISAVEAVSSSADVLIDQFRLFSHMGRPAMPIVERGLGAGIQLAARQVQHADRGPEPLDARIQLPAPQRSDDHRPGAREERRRAPRPPQLRPQVLRRAARKARRAGPPVGRLGRGLDDDYGDLGRRPPCDEEEPDAPA